MVSAIYSILKNIVINIKQIFLKFLQTYFLHQIVKVLLQITEPHIIFLPIDKFSYTEQH